MVLSDHGAEVIKLEPPQGDETREWGPPFDDAGDASYFLGILMALHEREKSGCGQFCDEGSG
jgi:crotonobetainyl-CoA:carnitine CoA-transferase CaiB-like acyl-CoA transferase